LTITASQLERVEPEYDTSLKEFLEKFNPLLKENKIVQKKSFVLSEIIIHDLENTAFQEFES